MEKLNYLNLGCGYHYNDSWVNVDFIKSGENVIPYNLLNGIPFPDNKFDVVYHSHVLEHFSKNDAFFFLNECFRVLKPNGILRIAIPDLEQIVKNYLRIIENGKKDFLNEVNFDDYEWIMIEMYDQCVRSEGGGEMLKFLSKKSISNEKFVIDRIGFEGSNLRKGLLEDNQSENHKEKLNIPEFLSRIVGGISRLNTQKINNIIFKCFFKNEYNLIQEAKFRRSGEIHQWMYDFYSLNVILGRLGFGEIEKKEYNTSRILNWSNYNLDHVNGNVRKPDSLFLEAIKINNA